MGYRSDVILAMKHEKFKELLKTMDDRLAIRFLENQEVKERDNWVLIDFVDVKWYEDFAEVKAVNTFVDTLDEQDFSYHILGEEDDDYTKRGTWDTPFEIRLNRSLDFSF